MTDPYRFRELDARSGDGERPLDVFEHPFAYAAHHGIEPRTARIP